MLLIPQLLQLVALLSKPLAVVQALQPGLSPLLPFLPPQLLVHVALLPPAPPVSAVFPVSDACAHFSTRMKQSQHSFQKLLPGPPMHVSAVNYS